jgi:hypothetical protein
MSSSSSSQHHESAQAAAVRRWFRYEKFFHPHGGSEDRLPAAIASSRFAGCVFNDHFNMVNPDTGSISFEDIERKPVTYEEYISRVLEKHAFVSHLDPIPDVPPLPLYSGWAYSPDYARVPNSIPVWQIEWVDNEFSFVHSTHSYLTNGRFALRALEFHRFRQAVGPMELKLSSPPSAVPAMFDDAVRLILQWIVLPSSRPSDLSSLKCVSHQFYRIVWELSTFAGLNANGQSFIVGDSPNAGRLLSMLSSPPDPRRKRFFKRRAHAPLEPTTAPLHRLCHLDASGCNFDVVGPALHLFASTLRTLILARASKTTQKALIKHVAIPLTSLRSLSLQACDDLEDMSKLAPLLTHLSALSINNCAMLGQKAVDAICTHCTQLERLDIGQLRDRVTRINPPDSLVALRMDCLSELRWIGANVMLIHCQKLRLLDISRQTIQCEGTFSQISFLTNLEVLHMFATDVRCDQSANAIKALPKLRVLNLTTPHYVVVEQHVGLRRHMLFTQRNAAVSSFHMDAREFNSCESPSCQYWTHELTQREVANLQERYNPRRLYPDADFSEAGRWRASIGTPAHPATSSRSRLKQAFGKK